MNANFGPFLQKLNDRKLIFVSGKGGVGKSLLAASIAHEQARVGRRALLVEVGETSYFKDFWGLPRVGHDPVGLPGNVDLALWSGETCLKEYVLHLLKMERLYKLFFENRVMRSLVNVAPGLTEVAILGKITSGIRKVGPPLDYDVIVIDMPATGHALSMLRAPKGLAEAIRVGPMGTHSREMDRILRDADLCAYVVVSLLEELPVVETLEFARTLKSEFQVEPILVANKVWRSDDLNFSVQPNELERLGAKSPALGFVRHFSRIQARQEALIAELRKSSGGTAAVSDNGPSTVGHTEMVLVPMLLDPDSQSLVAKAGEAVRLG